MLNARYSIPITMKITEICARDFNLAMTLNSGQVFHWEKAGRGFVGMIGDLPVYVEQNGTVLTLGGAPWPAPGTRALPRIVAHYFALDQRLAEICASFPDDPVMNAARLFCRG